jgi:hypothetical protein
LIVQASNALSARREHEHPGKDSFETARSPEPARRAAAELERQHGEPQRRELTRARGWLASRR